MAVVPQTAQICSSSAPRFLRRCKKLGSRKERWKHTLRSIKSHYRITDYARAPDRPNPRPHPRSPPRARQRMSSPRTLAPPPVLLWARRWGGEASSSRTLGPTGPEGACARGFRRFRNGASGDAPAFWTYSLRRPAAWPEGGWGRGGAPVCGSYSFAACPTFSPPLQKTRSP